MSFKIPDKDDRNTLSDPKRWKNQYRSFKRLPYAMDLSNAAFRAGWDRIWGKDGEGTHNEV